MESTIPRSWTWSSTCAWGSGEAPPSTSNLVVPGKSVVQMTRTEPSTLRRVNWLTLGSAVEKIGPKSIARGRVEERAFAGGRVSAGDFDSLPGVATHGHVVHLRDRECFPQREGIDQAIN
jgi:hypothetical protein